MFASPACAEMRNSFPCLSCLQLWMIFKFLSSWHHFLICGIDVLFTWETFNGFAAKCQFSSFLHRTVPTHLKSYVLSFLWFFALHPLPHPASQVFACPHPVSLPPPLPGTLTADPRPTESPTVESWSTFTWARDISRAAEGNGVVFGDKVSVSANTIMSRTWHKQTNM